MTTNSTSGFYPAVVTIPGLQAATLPLDSSVVFEAVQTSNGTTISVQVPLTAIMTTVQGTLPTGGGTGQILNKASASSFDAQWSNINQFVAVGTGLATSGSATSIVLSFATQTAISVLGVAGSATTEPQAIHGSAAQVLRVNDAGNALAFGAINLASAAAVTGVLPVPSGGTNTTTMTAWGVVFANNTSSLGATSPATTGWPLLAQGTAAAPAFGQLNLASTGFTGVLPVPNGGTNTSILTLNGVVFGNGTSTVGITAAGATGSVLVSALGGVPTFTTAPVIATSVTVPTIFGGTAAASGITIKGTSSTSPVADSITLQVGGLTAVFQKLNATTPAIVFNLNATAATTTIGFNSNGVRLVGQDGTSAGFLVNTFAQIGLNTFTRANGSGGGPSALASGDSIGGLGGSGYDGAAYSGLSGAARFNANETWNATSHGTRFEFLLTANGTTTITANAVLYPAALTNGGATALLFTPTASFGLFVGTGVPSISAATGSLYLRNDGNTNTTRMYVNINGTGTWTAVNTVA